MPTSIPPPTPSENRFWIVVIGVFLVAFVLIYSVVAWGDPNDNSQQKPQWAVSVVVLVDGKADDVFRFKYAGPWNTEDECTAYMTSNPLELKNALLGLAQVLTSRYGTNYDVKIGCLPLVKPDSI